MEIRLLSFTRRLTRIVGALAAFCGTLPTFPGDISERKMCWAHYVPWHLPDNGGFTATGYLNAPYCDVSASAFRDEVALAREHGIDGFLVDVCAKPGEETVYGDLTKFLHAAEGTDFQVALCLDVKTSVSHQVDELVRMLALNGNHPNYPKWNGKYVVATYTWAEWMPDEWRSIREGVASKGFPLYLVANFDNTYGAFSEERYAPYAGTFERLYSFLSPGMSGIRAEELDLRSAAVCKQLGVSYMPTIWPGYYGAWFNGRNDYYQPYCGFDVMQENFAAAAKTFSDWVHFTTWNDHDETTLQARRLSPALKRILRAYGDQLKGIGSSNEVDVAFAYHREVFPGTVLRIEAMRLPSGDRKPIKVGGRIRDVSGNVLCRLPELAFSGDHWERKEWVLDTAELMSSSELRPEFGFLSDTNKRRAKFPSVFLVSPYLHGPETVRCSFGDIPDVSCKIAARWSNGILEASAQVSSERNVKRLVLFADDLPVAQFDSRGGDEITVPVVISGRGSFDLKTTDAEVVCAARKFLPNVDWFGRDAHRVWSQNQVEWEPVSVLLRGEMGSRIEFSVGESRISFSLSDVASRTLTCGGLTVAKGLDSTIYCRRPFAARDVSAELKLACSHPKPETRYWVQVECDDGTTFESDVIHPGMPKCEKANFRILRTPVNLDTKSGASGIPGMREFLTDYDDMCVKDETIVTKEADRRIFRTFSCEPKGKPYAMPKRVWPSGAYTVLFAYVPTAGERQLIRHEGNMDGIGVRQLSDGRLEVTRTSGLTNEGGVVETLVSSCAISDGVKHVVKIACSLDKLKLEIDGKPDSCRNITPQIRYGNCSVFLEGIEMLQFFVEPEGTCLRYSWRRTTDADVAAAVLGCEFQSSGNAYFDSSGICFCSPNRKGLSVLLQ